jgi:hypothetical protein
VKLRKTGGGVKFCFGILAGRTRLSTLRTKVVAAGIPAGSGAGLSAFATRQSAASARRQPSPAARTSRKTEQHENARAIQN